MRDMATVAMGLKYLNYIITSPIMLSSKYLILILFRDQSGGIE
jgi:hypothetical protein